MKSQNFLTLTAISKVKRSIKKISLIISLLLLSSIGFTQYTLEAKVVGTPRVSGDHMGHHGGNAIDGDYMVAGAHLVDTLGFGGCGAAFLYHWNDSTCVWEQIDKIFAESAIGVLDLELNADFGVSVALEGDIIAIGASLRNNGFTDAGRVYIYRIIDDEAVFVQVLNARNNAVIDSDDREFNAQFGTSLKMHGQRLIIGAPFESEQDSTLSITSAG
ncbi:MAG: FG-GAP repeat protein, partial [Crocinitomix sp.]|nr:FG-GAP repeat protein [Crocinitomix sp.]